MRYKRRITSTVSPSPIESWTKLLYEWWYSMEPHERPARVMKETIAQVLGQLSLPPWPLSRGVLVQMGIVANAIGFSKAFAFEKNKKIWFYVPTKKMVEELKLVERRRSEKEKEELQQTFVYFIQSVEGGPIKIGSSVDVLERLKSLQVASPYRLRILIAFPESEYTEVQLHETFKNLRISGEWFKPEDSLVSFIDDYILQQCRLKHPRSLFDNLTNTGFFNGFSNTCKISASSP